MFKLYKKLRPVDWILLVVLVGLTVLQVYCTMTLADFVQDIIKSITFLGYKNNPAGLPAELMPLYNALGDWSNFTVESLGALGITGESAEMLLSIAGTTTGEIGRAHV